MTKKQLVAEVMDIWTDTFYTEVSDLVQLYSTKDYTLKEHDELTEKVIFEMVKFYAQNNSYYNEFINKTNK